MSAARPGIEPGVERPPHVVLGLVVALVAAVFGGMCYLRVAPQQRGAPVTSAAPAAELAGQPGAAARTTW